MKSLYKRASEQLRTNLERNDRVMFFDLSVRGHHPNYIRHLVQYWLNQDLPGTLDIVVSSKFFREHSDVVALANYSKDNRVRFISLTLAEESKLKPRKKSFIAKIIRRFQEWQLFEDYAKKLRITHGLILYLDPYFIPLCFKSHSSCFVSGIYFRPTFHYRVFPNYLPSWQNFLQTWREQILLSLLIKKTWLTTLFCLDQYAVEELKKSQPTISTVHLPDPVQLVTVTSPQILTLREKLEIAPNRRIFLLFGSLNGRKGIDQLLDAVRQLPSELSQQTCLLLVGESAIAPQIAEKVVVLCQDSPVQVIQHYEFVSEAEVNAYFHLADVVLAPYQQHVGMSGVLLLAAATQKPVLSSDYGLMGELVRRYQLGLTVDSTSSHEICQGLIHFLTHSPQDLCQPALMKSFAEQNSAEQFAQVIFSHLKNKP